MQGYYIYNKIWSIYCSFVIGVIFQLFTVFLFKLYVCFQPSWMMMLLLYWVMMSPDKVSIGTGFTLGLFIDYIFDCILGTHAASFSVLTYLTIRKRIFLYSVYQQIFFILFFSIINQSIKLLIVFATTKVLCSAKIFLSCVLDSLIWPFLVYCMNIVYRYQLK